MKKYCALILAFVLFVLSALPALADAAPVDAEEAIPFVATVDEDFEGGILIVCIKKEYSVPNKVWQMSQFGNPEHITSYADLTACDDSKVITSNIQNENFRQILEIHLDTVDKQIALNVAATFSESPYVYSVSVNHIYELDFETPVSSEDSGVALSSNIVSANEFESTYRQITEDPFIDSQYSIFTTYANRAWAITTGSSTIKVGVIDTGIDPIPDLENNLYQAYNLSGFSYNDSATSEVPTESFYDADYDTHHGTRVASVIAAEQNDIGISGIAPDIKLVSLRVAYNNSDNINDFGVARAFVLAQNLSLPIVNFSINNSDDRTSINTNEQDLLTGLDIYADAGWLVAMQNYTGLIVNSAGNNDCSLFPSDDPVDVDDEETPIYPGKFKDNGLNNIIVVGSVDEYNEWDVSNWGDEYVDLMAPGVYITTAYGEVERDSNGTITSIQSYYDAISGSSFSAPMVAATAALLLSYNPNLTVQQLKNAILNNVTVVDELSDKCITSGILNVNDALLSIGPAMYNYCISISTNNNAVSSAFNITTDFPADELRLTDVYVNSWIKSGFYYGIDINEETGHIDMFFGSNRDTVSADTVVFEFWFAAPADSITDKFSVVNGELTTTTNNTTLSGVAFLLGDGGRTGTTDSVVSWIDFCLQCNSFMQAVDVNRDHVINNDDKVRAQQYLNGEIKSLF